jgi:hypothetical protein
MTRQIKGNRTALMHRIVRFVFLAVALLIPISLLFFAEALVIWLRWPQLMKSFLHRSDSVRECAISANGEWGVSRMAFGDGEARSGTTFDVVLFNLRKRDAAPLVWPTDGVEI